VINRYLTGFAFAAVDLLVFRMDFPISVKRKVVRTASHSVEIEVLSYLLRDRQDLVTESQLFFNRHFESQNWRAQPLIDLETIIELIEHYGFSLSQETIRKTTLMYAKSTGQAFAFDNIHFSGHTDT